MASSREQHARKDVPHGIGDSELWTINHLNRLLAMARAVNGMIGTTPARLWWNAFLLVLLDTALAFRELLALLFSPAHRHQNPSL